MTISSETRRAGPFIGSGVIVAYPFAFKVFEKTDLRIVRAIIATGVTSDLVLDSDYSVTLNVDQNSNPGGSVAYLVAGVPTALPITDTLTIVGNLPFLQETDITNGGGFYPEVIEDAFDRVTMLTQQTDEKVERALQLDVATDPAFDATLPAPVANRIIGWGPDGLSLMNFAADTSISTDVLRADLASTADAAKGPALIGLNPTLSYAAGTSGARLGQFFTVRDIPWLATGDGVTVDQSAIAAADTAAAAAGKPLVFPPGTYLMNASHTFSSRVVMMPGARIKTAGSGNFLKLSDGFEAGFHYCLDTDWNTQFVGILAILPQWFGPCGLTALNSSLPMQRAHRAARAGMNGISKTTDASFGCVRVYYARGNYRCNNVDVYCQTIIDGEVSGAINGAYIVQIDPAAPALRMHAKNYSLTNTVLNDSNGINTIHRVNLRGETVNDASENAPIVQYYSPAQSTALFGISGDGVGGDVGHIDTYMERVWCQFSPGSVFAATDGMLAIVLKDCVGDVVRRFGRFSDTARGSIRSYGCQYFECVRGAFENVSAHASGVSLYSYNDKFQGCGNPQNANSAYQRAIHWNPGVVVAGATVVLRNASFTRVDDSGTRFGGPLFINGVGSLYATGLLIDDSDGTSTYKSIVISSGLTNIQLSGQIISRELVSYTNARLITISQNPQTVRTCRIEIDFDNTNASAIQAGIHSDFAFTNLQAANSTFNGAFTNLKNSNITEYLTGSIPYDPPSLADGVGVTPTVTVNGAVLGDIAVASFSLDLQGVTVTAWVSATNTVSVRFQNESGGVLDLASGTLSAKVWKR